MERGVRGPMDVHLLHLRCASERFDHYIDYYERQIQELVSIDSACDPRKSMSNALDYVQGRDALTTTENQTHIDAKYSPSFTSIIEKMFQMVHFLQINKYAAEQLREMFQQFNRHGLKATRSTTQLDPLTNTESTVEAEVTEKYFHDTSDEEYYFKHMNSYLAQTQQQEKRVKVLIDRANNFASLVRAVESQTHTKHKLM